MMLNEAIANLISDDRFEQHYVYQELRKRWPQINEQTHIAKVREYNVYIASMKSLPMRMIWVVISGFRRLMAQLMPSKRVIDTLDDPVARWAYQKRVWGAIFNSPKYIFWRVMGRAFHKIEWTRRGMEQQPDPIMPNPDVEVIRLERVAWQMQTPDSWFNPMSGRNELICAYYPPRDTLYVYDRGQK